MFSVPFSLTVLTYLQARAIWHHYDDSASSEFIQERQLMHVEILSFMSFCGRLTSGMSTFDAAYSRIRTLTLILIFYV